MEVKLDVVFEALAKPLALVESPERRAQLEAYLDAARAPLERAVLDLLSQVCQAADEQVADHYRVRLTYRSGTPSVEVEPKVGGEERGPFAAWTRGEMEKITLRIPAEFKELAAEAATQAGLSVNSWFVRTLSRTLRAAADAAERTAQEPKRRGGRLHGWVGDDE